jgi:hypothetical protein
MICVSALRWVGSRLCAANDRLRAFQGVSVRRSKGRVSDKVRHYSDFPLNDAAPTYQRRVIKGHTWKSTTAAALRRARSPSVRCEIPRQSDESSKSRREFELNQVCRPRDKVVVALRVELA